MKVILKGNVGTQSLGVVPPNLGDEAASSSRSTAAARYCAAFGGAAGGAELKDDAQLWKIINNAGVKGCPAR